MSDSDCHRRRAEAAYADAGNEAVGMQARGKLQNILVSPDNSGRAGRQIAVRKARPPRGFFEPYIRPLNRRHETVDTPTRRRHVAPPLLAIANSPPQPPPLTTPPTFTARTS